MSIRLSRLTLPSSDPAKAIAFYSELSGARMDGPDAVVLGSIRLQFSSGADVALVLSGGEIHEDLQDPDGRKVEILSEEEAEPGDAGVPFNPEDREEDRGIG